MSREEIMDAFCYFYRDLERSHLTEGKVDTNNSEAAEYFYSVDGSSPKEFGFAYDGPVLLDVVGDVELKIVKVTNDITGEIKLKRQYGR